MLSWFKNLLPPTRPEITEQMIETLEAIVTNAGIDPSRFTCIIGLRGFFTEGKNKRAIYDDAIFIIGPKTVKGFNANCDPGAFRTKIATLKPGKWIYKIGIHGLSKPVSQQYTALVQAKPVVVTRDNISGEFKGYFGINIHKGSKTSVSSLGCQTIHPSQWEEFITHMTGVLEKQITVTYILKEYENA